MPEVFDAIEISHNDKREYRHITLDNKLEAVLIHDPETEKCSACCDVRVGSMSDPEDVQGLAHFLEHMLFMGTEKYPEENAYSAYLSAHGGFSNAYTAQEDTVYYFDVQNDHFEGALDMFASFFWCPLFSQSSTEREMQAVDNENTKNLQSDTWRCFQLLKSLSKSDNPYSKFSTGNLETLKQIPEEKGINIREQLLQFHAKYYSANVMRVVVYGVQPLDTLQTWVEEKFNAIENKNLPTPSYPLEPYGPDQLGKYVEVVPVKDLKAIDIYFPLPSMQKHYRTKPMEYISHLIGHEGAGSILSALKAKGWANSLGSYLHTSQSNFSCFMVNVGLTDEGIEHVEDVAAIVFGYIGMLKLEGPKQWIATEVQETCAMNFRFLEKTEPADYATRIAEAMHLYPREHIVSGNALVFDVDLSLVVSSLEYLTPSNSMVMVKHKGLTGKTTLSERWYGTQYSIRPFTKHEMSKWSNCLAEGKIESSDVCELTLPIPNPFIPTEFQIYPIPPMWEASHNKCLREGPLVIDYVVVRDESLQECYAVGEEGEQNGTESYGNGGSIAGSDDEGDSDNEDGGHLPPPTGKALRTWFMQDSKWLVPKLNLSIKLQTHYAYSTPLNVSLCEMFANILKEILNEFSYYADCAGLYYDVLNTNAGLVLTFSGYHHKLPVLVSKAIEDMKAMGCGDSSRVPFKSDMFDRVKERILRGYFNSLYWQPYNHCVTGTLSCLENPRWSNPEKHSALSGAGFDDFVAFSSVLMKCIFAEVCVHGNIISLEAKNLSANIVSELGCGVLPDSLEPIRRAVKILPGVEYVYRQHSRQFNPKEVNSAIENTYVICDLPGLSAASCVISPSNVNTDTPLAPHVHNRDVSTWNSLALAATLELVSHLLMEPSFDQLRTKEQLGYLVHSSRTVVGSQAALRVIVQSNHKDPIYLNTRVEAFLESYFSTLKELTAQELEHNKKAVIDSLLEKPKNLSKEFQNYWNEITTNQFFFSRRDKYAEYVATISREDLLVFYEAFLLPNSGYRRKFSSQFFGCKSKFPPKSANAECSTDESLKEVLISDPAVFKRSMPLMPVQNYEHMLPVTSA